MLAGGLLARFLLERIQANEVVLLGLMGTATGLAAVIFIYYLNNVLPVWFFLSTLVMYLSSGLLFAGGSYLASNAVSDKASGAAMMSFINMVTATLAVIVMGYVNKNSLAAFIIVLSALWILVLFLLMTRHFLRDGKAILS
jgi:MFS transporter, DHA1 family, multidrug resistance protein